MPRGSKPFFTAEQEQEVVHRYAAGETLRAIGASYGVTWRPVQSALERHGITRRTLSDYRWKPTPENCAEVVRLWHEGLGLLKIAKKVQTDSRNVSQVLRDAGIKTRYGGSNHRFKKDEIPALIEEYAATRSLAQMARRHECSTAVIRKTLQRNGVEIAPYKGSPTFWTEERLAWLDEQFKAGRNLSDVAVELGRAEDVVARRARARGVLDRKARARRGANHAWKGGRIIDSNDYIRIRVPADDRHLVGQYGPYGDGYVLEHRLVMARTIGRPCCPPRPFITSTATSRTTARRTCNSARAGTARASYWRAWTAALTAWRPLR